MAQQALIISRILHAGYVFEYEGTKIAFDPIFENPFSRNCFAFPEVSFALEQVRELRFDAVFISHYHDDHCSLASLDLLRRETPIYLFCVFDELFEMIRALGFEHVHRLELDQSVWIDDIEVTPRRALDEDVDSIFHIKAGGLNVLNVVDSWIGPETMEILKRTASWDLVLWPFQTMREIEVLSPSRFAPSAREIPHEWIEQLTSLAPRNLIMSSCQFRFEDWSWYNRAFFPISYDLFSRTVGKVLAKTQLTRLDPGRSLRLSQNSMKPSEALSWIVPVGDLSEDYVYEPHASVPTTSEIASRFAELEASQSERVFEFCRIGILRRFKEIGPAADPYFNKSRVWRLSVFDHLGTPTHFHYRIADDEMVLLEGSDGRHSWLTEVSIARLYGALFEGESLTSMYVRVNDCVFAADIETEVRDADVLDDPLIRCLFNGVFGTYQAAQLKRLQDGRGI